MPEAYSTDLRERVLVAVEAGEPADVVAEAFMVGRSSVYRWIAAVRDERRRAPKPRGRRPKPIIRDETEMALCRLLEADNRVGRPGHVKTHASVLHAIFPLKAGL